MLLFPIVEILRTRDFHSKTKVTQAAGQVCLHQDVTGIQVPVTDARFQLVWKQDDTRSVKRHSDTKTRTSNMCTATYLLFSHLCVGGQGPSLQLRTSCRMWANPTHSFWDSLADNHLGHKTKPADTPNSFLNSLVQHSLQTKRFLRFQTTETRQLST